MGRTDAGPTRCDAAPPPGVQLLGGLHEARLVGLLEHLVRVPHQARVVQHGAVLLQLQPQFAQPLLPPLLHAAQQRRPLLLQRLAQRLQQPRRLLAGLGAVLLREPRRHGAALRAPRDPRRPPAAPRSSSATPWPPPRRP